MRPTAPGGIVVRASNRVRMKILLVEDDPLLGSSLQSVLEEQRHVVEWVDRFAAARSALDTGVYQLLVLDLGLPDGDGRDLIRSLRKSGNQQPILVLSARGEIRDRVAALDLGADDYLVKPFDLDELLARVRATARRPHGVLSAKIAIGGIEIDLAACRVWRSGELVSLRPREFQILATLVERRNRVVSRGELEELLTTREQGVESNTVEVFVHHLRRKLGTELIETVRGTGYVIRAD